MRGTEDAGRGAGESSLELIDARARIADRLLELGAHLPPPDRALLEAVYRRGMSAAEVARATRRRPRAVQHRLDRIVRRITAPLYVHMACRRAVGPRLRREVGELIVLKGISQRRAAARLGVTLHRVRRELDRLRALAEARGAGS